MNHPWHVEVAQFGICDVIEVRRVREDQYGGGRAHPRVHIGVLTLEDSCLRLVRLWVPAFGALFRGFLAAREVIGGVDERDVAERLREVAHLAPCARVVLL